MEDIKIYNQNKELITRKEVDENKGYLSQRTELIKHHEVQAAVPAQTHLEVVTVYFTDGTSYKTTGIDDPNIEAVDAEIGLFNYIGTEKDAEVLVQGMDVQRVEDAPAIEYQPEWDETEIVYDYILYTPEELATMQKQKDTQKFIQTGEQRLSQNERAINDLTLSMAEMLGA